MDVRVAKLRNKWLPALTGWHAYKAQLAADKPKLATRKSSENALGVLTAAIPAMIGGSADLTGSNNTKTPSTPTLDADNYGGRYVNYGIREFGMAAAWPCMEGSCRMAGRS